MTINKKIDLNNKIRKKAQNKTTIMANNKKKGSKTKKKSTTKKPLESKRTKKQIEPKRRGRRPKKIIDEDDIVPVPNKKKYDVNNSAVIVRLPFDPTKDLKKPLKKPRKKIIKEIVSESSESSVSSESFDGMFHNDIPPDYKCKKCGKNEALIRSLRSKLEVYEKKDKIEKSNKITVNKIKCISLLNNKKVSLKKTDVPCRWDHHRFSNIPFFLPELHINGVYYVTYSFCSANCALAYNMHILRDSKVDKRKSLVYKKYREMYGLSPDDDLEIKVATQIDAIDTYLGSITIDEYRQNFNVLDRDYIVYIPPLKPLNIIVEECNGGYDDSNKKYVLKRSKPLMKKGSIITAMNIKMKNNDD